MTQPLLHLAQCFIQHLGNILSRHTHIVQVDLHIGYKRLEQVRHIHRFIQRRRLVPALLISKVQNQRHDRIAGIVPVFLQ